MKHRMLIILLIFLILLSSCAKNHDVQQSEYLTENNTNPDPLPVMNLSFYTPTHNGSLLTSPLSSGDSNVLYGILPSPGGYADILVYDCESRVIDYLGGESKKPASIVNSIEGGVSLINVNDYLVTFKMGTHPDYLSKEGTSSIITIRQIDAAMQSTITLPMYDEIQIDTRIATDGNNLYFILLHFDEETTLLESQQLCKLDIEEAKIIPLMTLSDNGVFTLNGCCENGIILDCLTVNPNYINASKIDQLNNIDHTLSVYSPIDNVINEFYKYNNQDGIVVFDDLGLFFKHKGDSVLYSISSENGTLSPFYDLSAINDQYETCFVRNITWDHHIIVGFTDSLGINEYYGLDIITLSPSSLSSFIDSETNTLLSLVSESKDYFLIHTGDLDYYETYLGLDGKEWIASRLEPKYSLIPKQDFWNNIPNLIDFLDYVHLAH